MRSEAAGSDSPPGVRRKGSKQERPAYLREYGGSESPDGVLQEELFICMSASTAAECLSRRPSG